MPICKYWLWYLQRQEQSVNACAHTIALLWDICWRVNPPKVRADESERSPCWPRYWYKSKVSRTTWNTGAGLYYEDFLSSGPSQPSPADRISITDWSRTTCTSLWIPGQGSRIKRRGSVLPYPDNGPRHRSGLLTCSSLWCCCSRRGIA